jgi:hypothetical protein
LLVIHLEGQHHLAVTRVVDAPPSPPNVCPERGTPSSIRFTVTVTPSGFDPTSSGCCRSLPSVNLVTEFALSGRQSLSAWR